MKKETKKSVITTELNKNLIEGAELLITEIKTPAALLDFMFESSYWMEEFEKELRRKPCTFSARNFFKVVLQPWFAGGKNVIEKIAMGLHELTDAIGSEGYDKFLSELIQAFGITKKQGFYVDDSDKYLNIIGTMLKLSPFIQSYEYDLREQSGLSEAV